MSEARDGTVEIGDDGIPVRRRPGEPAGPLGHSVSGDVTIKKRIQERAPIVAPPALSMQLSDGFRVVRCRLPVLHTPIFPDPSSRPRSGAWFCVAVGCASLGIVSTRFTDLAGMPPNTCWRHAARDGGDAVVRRETGDQTDQESRSVGHGAATSMTAMDITIHWTLPPA
jgi:hypothetical protein